MNKPVLEKSDHHFYQENGFVVLPNFISIEECNTLMERASHLVNKYDFATHKTTFSTTNPKHAQAQYFLDSGDKIRFFFEENALTSDGELRVDKFKSINKIGHALHDRDSVFNKFSYSEKIVKLAQDLDIEQPLLLQSMYIYKQPYIGGEVTCHQDSTYLHTIDNNLIGLWFALEDATLENGCLWAIPGGHNNTLKSRLIRMPNHQTKMEIYDENPWELNDMVPLPVKQGSLIVLHGLLPHMSKQNTSPCSRQAYTLHIISGNKPYPATNWLQRS